MKHPIPLLFLAASLLVSCNRYQGIQPGFAGYELNDLGADEYVNDYDDSFNSEGRIVAYAAELYLTVKDIDSAGAKVSGMAGKYGGYILEAASGYTSFRVPATEFENSIQDIQHLGKVESKVIEGRDITDEYFDNKLRLEAAGKARDRYLELLKSAQNVEEMVMVENEVERLNSEMEYLKGSMNQLQHMTKYSTITVWYRKKRIYGPLGYLGLGIYKFFRLFVIIT